MAEILLFTITAILLLQISPVIGFNLAILLCEPCKAFIYQLDVGFSIALSWVSDQIDDVCWELYQNTTELTSCGALGRRIIEHAHNYVDEKTNSSVLCHAIKFC